MQFVLADPSLHWRDAWFLLQGAGHTLWVTAVAGLLGTLLGIALGWMRYSSGVLRVVTAPYIDVVRSVPLIIQLVLTNSFLALAGANVNTFWLCVAVLSSSMAVVTAEVVRAGLASVPPTFRRSARSLGLSGAQEFVHISAPLAVRTSFAAWVGLLLGLAKDSALVSVVGYVEFMKSSQILISRTHETLLLLAGVGIFYFVICYPVSRYSARVERRMAL
ncbi:amino acid ABC transporter permease [Pseudomonas sp. dw_358]|uniref:amino acid ABC transporter permease n=1 Tax=Pseudomonas sp. dw_358 TaxID=2720083 RepID=UPI001BD31F12|nr:amino acid ABC transporter permease [Pseudomonas sp. dw_358]